MGPRRALCAYARNKLAPLHWSRARQARGGPSGPAVAAAAAATTALCPLASLQRRQSQSTSLQSGARLARWPSGRPLDCVRRRANECRRARRRKIIKAHYLGAGSLGHCCAQLWRRPQELNTRPLARSPALPPLVRPAGRPDAQSPSNGWPSVSQPSRRPVVRLPAHSSLPLSNSRDLSQRALLQTT